MNNQQNPSIPLYFGILIIAYLLFIALASFYLTGAVPLSQSVLTGTDKLFFLPGEFRLRFWNLRDVSTNLLLYMPLGFLVALFLAAKGKSLSSLFYLCLGIFISIIIETSQAFTGRFSDATDVISNGLGYMIGFLVARASLERYNVRPAFFLGFDVDKHRAKLNTLAGLRFAFVSVVIVTALLPFDLSVSMTQIYTKLQPSGNGLPRLIVDPLYHFKNIDSAVRYLTLKTLLFLPLAFLTSYIQFQRNRPSLLIPAFHCLLLALTIECANLFVLSGRSDIFIPVLGFSVGMMVAALMVFFTVRLNRASAFGLRIDFQYAFISIAILYCLFLFAISLSPYEFELSLRSIREKLLVESNFIPFRLHFSTRNIHAAVDMVREPLLYAPLGALLTLWLSDTALKLSLRTKLLVAAVLSFSFAVWIEILQLAIVGRCVDITDILLAAAGGLGGAAIAPLFKGKTSDDTFDTH